MKTFLSLIFLIFGTFCAQSAPQWGENQTPAAAVPPPPIWGQTPSALSRETAKNQEETVAFFNLFKKQPEKEKNNSLPTWLENAVAQEETDSAAPLIAIVIDDLGTSKKLTRQVADLPAPITMAFMAYADDLPAQTQYAAENGHELLVHVPMEPLKTPKKAGNGALLTSMTADEIKDRLELMLNSFDGYVGINNHMGSRFTSDESAMTTVMRELSARGLLFLDSMTTNHSQGRKTAEAANVPYIARNVFLDNSQTQKEIAAQLKALETAATEHRAAIGIGHPHAATIKALKSWIPAAKNKGFAFVPISTVAAFSME